MRALLVQLAVLLGAAVAGISLLWNLSLRMDLLTAAFRAVLVFFGTVMVLFCFLHYFSVFLVRFVTEKVLQQRAQKDQEGSLSSNESKISPDKPKTKGV